MSHTSVPGRQQLQSIVYVQPSGVNCGVLLWSPNWRETLQDVRKRVLIDLDRDNAGDIVRCRLRQQRPSAFELANIDEDSASADTNNTVDLRDCHSQRIVQVKLRTVEFG